MMEPLAVRVKIDADLWRRAKAQALLSRQDISQLVAQGLAQVVHMSLEPGEVEYPCRCGQTHTGPYAYEDWRHHNCFHEVPILVIMDEQGVCPECGMSFTLERRKS